MADDHMSWRKQQTPSKISAKSSKGVQTYHNDSSMGKSPSKRAYNWRNKGSIPSRENHHVSKEDDGTSRQSRSSKGSHDTGPAAPLNPLHISHAKGLPHPSTYNGSDNWALTPNGSLPSLPATPSRAMNSMGWNHIALNGEEHRREGSGSRELSAARALLNRKYEEVPGTQIRSLSPAAFPTYSPKRPPRPLQSSSPSSSLGPRSPSSAQFPAIHPPVRPLSPTDGQFFASPPPMINTSLPPLRHRDSNNSVASSSILGPHALSHSRKASQSYVNSPASSIISPNGGGPGYRVYRPPHLRRQDSIHALKPKVAHYDRVRTPSLRGQSRSPDPLSLSKRLNREDGGTPMEASLTGRSAGRRRLSSLGSFNSSIYEEYNNRGTFDHRSLFAKLAANKNRKYSDASSFRPDESLDSLPLGEGKEEEDEVPDDIDLSAENLMGDAFTLTDEFCMSRTASIGENNPVVDIFQIGDRIGAGMMHDGLEVTIAETTEGFREQNEDLTGTQLEVVKKLGEGSYAVVYLVKEVPRDAERGQATTLRSDGVGIPKADGVREGEEGDETVLGSLDIYSSTLKANPSSSQGTAKEEEEGSKYFALKCLCKRDLTDEMLQVQRLEATIHQSIPPHPCIVTLYRTFETAEWLFLILEYCPGQDLFYWLEQAGDSTNLGSATPSDQGLELSDFDGDTTAIDSTPPSPSLLASTEFRFLLSTRRLRLISRMFQQMCQAVEFCHSRGISHRDIKPENFIVEDTRSTDTKDSIKVKLTDFGLAVAQDQCIDFDCGSKPYMSYECRNNQTRWYDPRQSDIWSLGIVLLNLIFHRNPFSEPNVDNCPSFASYVEDPVEFLVVAFRGLKREAAQFLAEKVFCDVSATLSEDDTLPQRRRISAKEFGEWASNLSKYLEPSSHYQHSLDLTLSQGLADDTVTVPLWSTRSPASSTRASPLPARNPRSSLSIHEELAKLQMHTNEEDVSYDSPSTFAPSGIEMLKEVKEHTDVFSVIA